jgi:hypothetical protein
MECIRNAPEAKSTRNALSEYLAGSNLAEQDAIELFVMLAAAGQTKVVRGF